MIITADLESAGSHVVTKCRDMLRDLRDIVVECEMLFLTTVDDILLFVEFSDTFGKEAMSGCS